MTLVDDLDLLHVESQRGTHRKERSWRDLHHRAVLDLKAAQRHRPPQRSSGKTVRKRKLIS